MDPTPGATTLNAHLIETNTNLGSTMVVVALWMLAICFVGLAIAALATWVQAIRTGARRSDEREFGTGGLGAVIDAIVKVTPELIKTPAGIGALILILGVVLLLGTAAIESNQLKDFGGSPTETVAPSASSAPAHAPVASASAAP